MTRIEANSSVDQSIDNEIEQQRRQFASVLSRVFTFAGFPVMFVLLAYWYFLTPQYTQIAIYAVSLLPILIPHLAHGLLVQRGLFTVWCHAILIGFLITIPIAALSLRDIIPMTGIGYVLVILLSYLLLGERKSRWIVFVSLIEFCMILLIDRMATVDWFEPLDQTSSIFVSAVLGVITLAISIGMIRIIVIGQDRDFRAARRANFEIEERAKVEQQQREVIEQANIEIEQRIATEFQQRQTLQALIEQIYNSATVLNNAAAEIQAAASQQVTSTLEQDTAVTQTVATVEEVRTTVQQTAERAQQVAHTAAESVNTSRVGQEAVTQTVDSVARIKQQVENIATNILALSERTQQIGEIIDTVNGLAEQSKLLALNASIEAARAGEEGKGFAVVAMEVRQLAEQSREATGRVRDILSEIQQATNSAVMVTEEGSKGAESGLTLVELAGESIRELAATIESAAQAATQIAASTHQQTNGMEQLAAAMTQIKAASGQSAASARQTEQSVRDLIDMAQRLESAAAQYQA